LVLQHCLETLLSFGLHLEIVILQKAAVGIHKFDEVGRGSVPDNLLVGLCEFL